ncbi:MAG: GntR family transcriptional regulator [Clostridium sp.]|nr:GntR family transcriptional regulator [Clostridium sp.]
MDEYFKKIAELTDLKQNKPLNEIVYEGLRNAIIQGYIPVGERINESIYSQKMNISRTPVREALRRIQQEGLVEYVPRLGVVVKKITIDDAKEIYQIRMALDILAATNAMRKMTEDQFEEMYKLLEETQKANDAEEVQKVVDLSRDFNDMIYEFAEMPRLESIVHKLREFLVRFRDMSLRGEERRKKALEEHWLIYKNMKNKNFDAIALIIQEHLEYSEEFIYDAMRKLEKVESEKEI